MNAQVDNAMKRAKTALQLARMTIEQRGTLDTRVCANGPAIRRLIEEAVSDLDAARAAVNGGTGI